jgi:hypothetical protein
MTKLVISGKPQKENEKTIKLWLQYDIEGNVDLMSQIVGEDSDDGMFELTINPDLTTDCHNANLKF